MCKFFPILWLSTHSRGHHFDSYGDLEFTVNLKEEITVNFAIAVKVKYFSSLGFLQQIGTEVKVDFFFLPWNAEGEKELAPRFFIFYFLLSKLVFLILQ